MPFIDILENFKSFLIFRRIRWKARDTMQQGIEIAVDYGHCDTLSVDRLMVWHQGIEIRRACFPI